MSEVTMKPLFSWRKAITISSLQPTTRLVAMTLSMHMNEAGGSCYPSQATLAAETGLSRSTVNTHIGILFDEGFIRISHRKRPSDGGDTSSLYAATIPAELVEIMSEQNEPEKDIVWLEPRVREDDTPCPPDGHPPTGKTTPGCSGKRHQEDVLEDATEDEPTCPPSGDNEDHPPLTDSKRSLALFDDWWANEYPNPTYEGRSHGKKTAARKAWTSLHKRKVTYPEILDRTRRYAKARDLFKTTHGHGVVEAPCLNASTFLNTDHDEWAEQCTGSQDSRIRYWVGPLNAEIRAATPSGHNNDVESVFETAMQAFLQAQRSTDPVTECQRILDATGNPKLWQAMQTAWPHMENKFEAKRRYIAAYTAVTESSAA